MHIREWAGLILIEAGELLEAHSYQGLIDRRTAATLFPITETAQWIGSNMLTLLHNGDTDQLTVESLHRDYEVSDQRYSEVLVRDWQRFELFGFEPLDHVTARLGNKATGTALAYLNGHETPPEMPIV